MLVFEMLQGVWLRLCTGTLRIVHAANGLLLSHHITSHHLHLFGCVAVGHLVSGFVKQQLPMMLVGHLTSGMAVQQALSAGFLEVDRGLAASRIDCEFSGSTCSVAYLKVGYEYRNRVVLCMIDTSLGTLCHW